MRVLLISHARRLLLVRYRNTDPHGRDHPCWTTPGGAIEHGETIEEAAQRELLEETGIADARLGPVIWYGEDSVRGRAWGAVFREHFILGFANTETLETTRWTHHERSQILELRWWTKTELTASDEEIYPLHLDSLIQPILEGIYPTALVDLTSDAGSTVT